MKVLIACEFSGIVRDAFSSLGHEAWSCDIFPTVVPGKHLQMDALVAVTRDSWDLMIAHPPCTHLAVSGARHFSKVEKRLAQIEALDFFRALLNAAVPRICIENPISIASTRVRKPDQIIQPWQFGHGEVKATCLWLVNLPKLVPTKIVVGRYPRVHLMPPSPNQARYRSLTYKGIALAMAEQWGSL